MSAREHDGDIVFLHKLQRGAASRSYGIAVPGWPGCPNPCSHVLGFCWAGPEQGVAAKDLEPSPRSGSKAARPQLGSSKLGEPMAPHPAIETLRAVDVDRLTPLEALGLVASLRKWPIARDRRTPRSAALRRGRSAAQLGYVGARHPPCGSHRPDAVRSGVDGGHGSDHGRRGRASLRDRVAARRTWQAWASVAWFGVADVLNVLLFFAAYKLTIAVAVLTHYLTPIFVALVAPLVLRERMTARTGWAIAASFSGLAVMIRRRAPRRARRRCGRAPL